MINEGEGNRGECGVTETKRRKVKGKRVNYLPCPVL